MVEQVYEAKGHAAANTAETMMAMAISGATRSTLPSNVSIDVRVCGDAGYHQQRHSGIEDPLGAAVRKREAQRICPPTIEELKPSKPTNRFRQRNSPTSPRSKTAGTSSRAAAIAAHTCLTRWARTRDVPGLFASNQQKFRLTAVAVLICAIASSNGRRDTKTRAGSVLPDNKPRRMLQMKINESICSPLLSMWLVRSTSSLVSRENRRECSLPALAPSG